MNPTIFCICDACLICEIFLIIKRREYESDPKLSEDEKSWRKTSEVVRDLDRIIRRSLFGKAPHLIESEVDIEPRHEAFWMAGGKFKIIFKSLYCVINIVHLIIGIEPPTDKKIWIERKVPLTEEEKNEPVDRPFQYVGKISSKSGNLFAINIIY